MRRRRRTGTAAIATPIAVVVSVGFDRAAAIFADRVRVQPNGARFDQRILGDLAHRSHVAGGFSSQKRHRFIRQLIPITNDDSSTKKTETSTAISDLRIQYYRGNSAFVSLPRRGLTESSLPKTCPFSLLQLFYCRKIQR